MSSNVKSVPSLKEFRSAVVDAFKFLKQYGFKRKIKFFDREFNVHFESDTYVLAVEGIHWGQATRTRLFDKAGNETPVFMFVPKAKREEIDVSDFGQGQLAFIRKDAMVVETYVCPVFSGDYELFERVRNEWKRMVDPEYAKSLQKRKLP